MIEEESFPLWGEFFLVHGFGLRLLRFPPCVGRGFCEGKGRLSEGVSFSLCVGERFSCFDRYSTLLFDVFPVWGEAFPTEAPS